MSARIRSWLASASPAGFSLFAIGAAFSAYFCMYAYRKPFAAATFDGETFGELDFKVALAVSQVVGYALSKFISIKFISEIPPARRAVVLLGLVGFAELALAVFAVAPPTLKIVAIFFNGLPLGAVWGLVFGFLEGRRTSELLGAGLSTSYIVASGAVKAIGSWLLQLGVSEAWMPAVVGLLFTPPFLIAVWLLSQLPQPTEEDKRARTAREPMRGPARIAFVKRFAFGLVCLTALYTLLTAYRDFRDNFSAEIWLELGWGDKPAIFVASELPIAVAVMLSLAVIYRVHGNRRALVAVHGLMLAGTILIGVSTLAFDLGMLGPVTWMIAVGMGLYLGYVPYGCVLFDRLIAATGAVGTAVFMIYVTDAFGYAGSVALLLYKNLGQPDLSWLDFFRLFSYTVAVVCSCAFIASGWYFARVTAQPCALPRKAVRSDT